LPLPRIGSGREPPRFIAVSATNLHELYFHSGIFASLRGAKPDRVLGRTILIFQRRAQQAPAARPQQPL